MQAVVESAIPARDPGGKPQTARRNTAVDVYRGLVMFLMMAEVLQLARVSRAYPGNWFWSILAWNQTHVQWAGCSLHDLIQPSFSFLVGVALPYSIASRLAKGATFNRMFAHALWRSLLLIWLGIFLRSLSSPMTNFTFEDTLTQIGLGYPFLFLLGFRPARWQWTALGVILTGYWLAWALYPRRARVSTTRPPAFPRNGSIISRVLPPTGIRTATWGRRSMFGSSISFRASAHFYTTAAAT